MREKVFLIIIVAVFSLAFLVHVIHSLTLDRKIEYTTKDIIIAGKKHLDGYKMTFLSDVHNMTEKEYKEVILYLNENIKPDILLLGGDYMPNKNIDIFFEITSMSEAKDGIYGVCGNHDIAKNLKIEMNKNHITFLENTGARINEDIYISGVEDYWLGKSDIKVATEFAKKEDFVVLVTHNPDVIMDRNMAKEMEIVDYTIAGHTHGGHVAFFGVFRPALSSVTDYKSLFGGGEVVTENSDIIYVSRGTGYYRLVPRVFSRPEVITFILKAKKY